MQTSYLGSTAPRSQFHLLSCLASFFLLRFWLEDRTEDLSPHLSAFLRLPSPPESCPHRPSVFHPKSHRLQTLCKFPPIYACYSILIFTSFLALRLLNHKGSLLYSLYSCPTSMWKHEDGGCVLSLRQFPTQSQFPTPMLLTERGGPGRCLPLHNSSFQACFRKA